MGGGGGGGRRMVCQLWEINLTRNSIQYKREIVVFYSNDNDNNINSNYNILIIIIIIHIITSGPPFLPPPTLPAPVFNSFLKLGITKVHDFSLMTLYHNKMHGVCVCVCVCVCECV